MADGSTSASVSSLQFRHKLHCKANVREFWRRFPQFKGCGTRDPQWNESPFSCGHQFAWASVLQAESCSLACAVKERRHNDRDIHRG